MRRSDGETGPITVVGAGAIGGTIGTYLHAAGHDVSLVDASEDHVRAVRDRGLRITGVRGDRTHDVPMLHISEFESTDRRLGTTLLCVKAHHTPDALELITPRLRETGCVVSLQNGLNEDVIADAVGEERTVGAFVHFGADLVAPGEISLGYEETIRLGELDGDVSPRIETLCGVLSDAMPTEPTEEIYGYLWGKLVFAAAGFAVSCVDAPVAEVLDDPLGLEIARRACSETYGVARREVPSVRPIGTFDPTSFDPDLEQPATGERALRRLAKTWRAQLKQHTGIWRDLRIRRRVTEGEAQLRPVIEAGAHHGAATPTVRAILSVVGEIEGGERGMGRDNLIAIMNEL